MSGPDVRKWHGSSREALLEENRLKAKRYRLVSPMTETQLEPGQYMKRPAVGDAAAPAGGWTLTWCPLPGDA
jgi:hypothetical protein